MGDFRGFTASKKATHSLPFETCSKEKWTLSGGLGWEWPARAKSSWQLRGLGCPEQGGGRSCQTWERNTRTSLRGKLRLFILPSERPAWSRKWSRLTCGLNIRGPSSGEQLSKNEVSKELTPSENRRLSSLPKHCRRNQRDVRVRLG